MSDPRTRVALPLITAAAFFFGWWAWKQGAYFGSVFYPGAILVFGLLALVIAIVPFGTRLDGPARVALVALVVFAGWTLLSALWSPTPASAIEYGEQAALYAALFTLGLWLVQQLRERSLLVLLPLAVAAVAVGIATVVVLATGTDVSWYLHEDGTLRFPIGYRNADAAFFLICLWPLVGIATWSELGRLPRALAAAGGTLVVELAVLSQSRGSLPALALALLVYLVFARGRLRAAAFVALVAIPAILALPALLDVFHYGKDDQGAIPVLRDAAKAIAWTTVASFAINAIAIALIEPRLSIGGARLRVLSWVAAVGATAVVVVGGAVFVAHHGGPVKFVDQRLSQFRKIGYPNLHAQGVRFGVNVGSNRHDFWRVSVDEGLEHPILGGGAGSFYLAYQQHRRSPEMPHDPHSVEAMAFSELGFPGIVMLVVFVVAAVLAAVRSRRRGPPVAAALTAVTVAGGAQWLLQSSYDWFWHYPAVTGAGIFLLGAAGGLGLTARSTEEAPSAAGPQRWVAAGACVLAAVVALPLFLSSRYMRSGEGEVPGDRAAAVSDFQSAADLDPLSGQPLILKGSAAAELGDRATAVAAFREAESREPDYYLPHLLLARELQRAALPAARAELAEARRLNPSDPEVAVLARRLERSVGGERSGGGG